MATWYQLGGKASMFFDPTQPDPQNQKLLRGEAKPLKTTDKVAAWVRGGGLVKLTENEALELNKANGDRTAKLNAEAEEKAKAILNKAAEKDEEAKEKLRQAEIKLQAADGIAAERDQLKSDNDALIKRIKELEDQQAGTDKTGESKKSGK